jgi:hypothetical protein
MKIDFITALISHRPGLHIATAMWRLPWLPNTLRHFYKLEHHEIR